MRERLSVVMITKNAEGTLVKSLKSTQDFSDEIVIIDDYSTDKTVELAQTYHCFVFHHHEPNLGKQKQYAVDKAKNNWILLLDADEVLTQDVKDEIKKTINQKSNYSGYNIFFQTHFLGKPLYHGGENYKKLILFKKDKAVIYPALVHEKVTITDGEVGELQKKIEHYSYQSLGQMYKKFTIYALREAKQKKQKGEKTSLKKILLYGPHMFWARFIKDKGYKDGLFRIPLDLGFGYMETLTYIVMLFVN